MKKAFGEPTNFERLFSILLYARGSERSTVKTGHRFVRSGRRTRYTSSCTVPARVHDPLDLGVLYTTGHNRGRQEITIDHQLSDEDLRLQLRGAVRGPV